MVRLKEIVLGAPINYLQVSHSDNFLNFIILLLALRIHLHAMFIYSKHYYKINTLFTICASFPFKVGFGFVVVAFFKSIRTNSTMRTFVLYLPYTTLPLRNLLLLGQYFFLRIHLLNHCIDM